MQDLGFFYVKVCSDARGIECWEPVDSAEDLIHASEYVYAEDLPSLHAAFSKKCPHPIPNFSHVTFQKRYQGRYIVRLDPGTSFPEFPRDAPLLTTQEFIDEVVKALQTYPSKYALTGETTHLFHSGHCFCGYSSISLFSEQLAAQGVVFSKKDKTLSLATQRQLAAIKRKQKKAKEKEKQREQARLDAVFPRSRVLECLQYLVTCLGLPGICFEYDYALRVDTLLGVLSLFSKVHGKYTYRKHAVFQKFLQDWRERNDTSKEKTKQLYPKFYAFLQEEAAIKAPRKLIQEVQRGE